ncbi:MAG: lipopolysaccharide biosynthesis protein [Pseudomonadota bacterium]
MAAKMEPVAERLDLAISDDGPRSVAARAAIFTFGVRVLAAIIAYATQVVLARMLGAYDYGIYAIIWVWVIVISVFAGLGFPTGLLRFIPELLETNRLPELRAVMVLGSAVNVGFCTLLAAGGVAFILLFPQFIDNAFVIPLVLAATCLPIMTLVDNQDGVAQAFDWPDLVTLPPFLVRPIVILFAFVAMTLAGVEATASTAMLATVFGVYLVSFAQLIILTRRVRKRIGPGPMEGSVSPWVKAAFPMLLVEGFFLLIINTDVMVAGWFIPPDQVAVYYAAAKTLALVHFVSFAIRVATMHKIAKYHAGGNKEALARTVADALNWTFWPTVALAVLLGSVGSLILSIFGEGFEAGLPFLLVLLFGVIIRSTVGPAESMLTMGDAQKTAAWIYALVFVANVCLNIVLIPTIGLIGAAIATAIAMLLETVLLFVMVKKRHGIVSFIGAIKHLQAAADDADREGNAALGSRPDPAQ